MHQKHLHSPLCSSGKRALLLALFLGVTPLQAQINLALNQPVTASAAADPINAPLSNLTDGNLNTYTSVSNAATGSNADWIRIDLGTAQFIETIRITARPGFHNRARRFLLLTWDDATAGPAGLGVNPNSYITDSRFNRLIYTDPNGVVPGTLFGSSASVPGTAGSLLGPDFTTLTLSVGVHKARYVMLLNLQHDVLDLNEIEVFPGPPAVRAFTNGDFETGFAGTGAVQIREGAVPGWSTTEAVAMSTANLTAPVDGSFMEFWSTGTNSAPSYSGNYFIELNAYTNAELSQQPVCVLTGETFSFSFAHRGRSGVDVMRLRINGVDVAEFSDNNAQTGTHTGTVLTPATTTLNPYTTTATGWTNYSGTWTNTTGAPAIVLFSYRAVSTAGGGLSVGNLMDAVTLTSLNTTVTFDRAAESGLESIPTGSLPMLKVSGTAASPLTVEIDIDPASTATRGADYTTPTAASGPITVTIPAGSYDGTAATAISLAPYIQVVSDASPGEPDETIIMHLQNPSPSLLVADASSCGVAITPHTYTIKDNPPISISGSVLDDANGSTDSTVNGSGTNAGGLNAVLIHNNEVAASVAVAANGAYSFSNLAPGQAYEVLITTNTAPLGSTPPFAALPANWVNTGENLGTAAGSDGTVNSRSNTVTPAADVVNLNFGIQQLPQSNTHTQPSQPLPSGTFTVVAPASGFGGSDPDGTVDSIRITTFPTNTTSIMIGGITYYANAGGIPGGCGTCAVFPVSGVTVAAPGGVPTPVIRIDPAGNTPTTVVISYSSIDNAGFLDPTPGNLTLPFSTPLYITWLQFRAWLSGKDAMLDWTVTNEVNTDKYIAECSMDGQRFFTVGTVSAIGSSIEKKYSLTHRNAADLPAASLFYRIREMAKDGGHTFSEIRTVWLNPKNAGAVSIYPNPASGGSVLHVTAEDIRKLAIYNNSGERVYARVHDGSSPATISSDRLLPGTYLLVLNGTKTIAFVIVP